MATNSRVGPLGALGHTPVALLGCIQHHAGGSSSWGQTETKTDTQAVAKLCSRALRVWRCKNPGGFSQDYRGILARVMESGWGGRVCFTTDTRKVPFCPNLQFRFLLQFAQVGLKHWINNRVISAMMSSTQSHFTLEKPLNPAQLKGKMLSVPP